MIDFYSFTPYIKYPVDMSVNRKHRCMYGGALTNQQLVDKDPYRPPVALPAIVTITTLRLEHLRGDVVWCAYSCVTVHHACLHTE